jgi:hypothetical protein
VNGPTELHHVELKELVLHDRLVRMRRCKPFSAHLALVPGKVDLRRDCYSYPVWTHDQALISRAKTNFKRLVSVYSAQWRRRGVAVELALSINPPIGRQRYMLASAPEHHAQRLEMLFIAATALDDETAGPTALNLWSQDFDAYVFVGLRPWLFRPAEDHIPDVSNMVAVDNAHNAFANLPS